MIRIYRALTLMIAASLVLLTSPAQAASYNETTVGDGTLAEFESDLNPGGLLGDDVWGWCYWENEPSVFPQSGSGESVNYAVIFGCAEGNTCVEGSCNPQQWDHASCIVEAYVATGWVLWEPITIQRNGQSHNLYAIDFNFNALSYVGTC